MTLSPIHDVSALRAFATNPDLCEFFRRIPPAWSMSDDALRSLFSTSYYVRKEDEPLGIVSLTGFDGTARSVKMGIALLPHEGRRELATKTCQLVGEYVFEALGYNKIVCEVLASRSDLVDLLSSFGFKKDGTLRDNVFFQGRFQDEIVLSLLRKEYHHGR